MFQQLKNIDTAFKHIKTFSLVLIVACTAICGFTVYKSYEFVRNAQQHIYILASGKALEAFSADRTANIPVEARDHIRMFHQYFLPSTRTIRSFSPISPGLYTSPIIQRKGLTATSKNRAIIPISFRPISASR